MTVWLHWAAFLLYAFTAGALVLSLARGGQRRATAFPALLGAGLVVHLAALIAFWSRWEELPLVGLGPSLSTLGFLIAVSALLAGTLAHAENVGLVLLPVVALLVGIAAVAGVVPAEEVTGFRDGWFFLHVVFAFVGYGGLTVAFAAGLMYLLQFRELKSKHFGAIFRFFPPLDTLDRLGWRALLIGFPFHTMALLAGWAWTARFEGLVSLTNFKLAWVLLSWVVFAVALLARFGSGTGGRRAALASVLGFLVVVVLYLVLRVQLPQEGTFL